MGKVSLIDFGFAKKEGATEAGADDSFWRAGSARCSPPAKLLHPRKAVASHDVFAVGVLAYQLLTGAYPWSVSMHQDANELRQHMLSHVPPRVDERNSLVSPDISRLVMGLLELSDRERPSSAEALQQTEKLREDAARRRPAVENPGSIFFPRVVRDPLYGDVRLTEYERDLLNTPEMQRLRHIKQLGLTNLVYPGAQHSRLAHAIGSVHRTEQMLSSIEDTSGVRIETETRLVARIYALVHDVTHVAFGHTIEDELGIFERHDANPERIKRFVLDSRSQIGATLRSNAVGEAVLGHFDDDSSIQKRSAVTDLVSGSTGADVLDYIDRDAYYCGVDHKVDSAIFRQFRLQAAGGDREERLVSLLFGKEGVRIDREYAVESLLSERYALFLKVYCHKRKNAASALLDKALSAALWGGRAGTKSSLTEPEYELLSDDVVIDRLVHSSRRAAKRAATRLQRRELPNGVYRGQLLKEDSRKDNNYASRQFALKKLGLFNPEERMALVAKLAKSAKVDPDDVYLYCPPNAPGYQRVKHWLSREPGQEEKADDVDSVFHDIKSRHLGLWELWVFYAHNEQAPSDAVAAAAGDLFGFPNRIEVNPRIDRLF
jgi:HD superfamily phosphohydrolase